MSVPDPTRDITGAAAPTATDSIKLSINISQETAARLRKLTTRYDRNVTETVAISIALLAHIDEYVSKGWYPVLIGRLTRRQRIPKNGGYNYIVMKTEKVKRIRRMQFGK